MQSTGGRTLVELTERREVTKRLKKQTKNADEKLQDDVWKYCKKLGSFTHAPVSLKHYQRMNMFASNDPLVAEIFTMLQGYDLRPNGSYDLLWDTIGYYYSIAVISMAEANRLAHLTFLESLARKMSEENHQDKAVLLRNIVRLSKEYPDLQPIEEILK